MAEKDNSLRILLMGFKGKNNSSGILVQAISQNYRLLTNSFIGVKKDIGEIDDNPDFLIMFGCDKNLKDFVRIERFAEKNGEKIASALDLENISKNLAAAEINNFISDSPGHYFCNEAYWYALQKFNNKAVFIHIPTIKNLDDGFINKMKKFVKGALRGKPPLEGVVSYKEANQGKAFPLLWI